MDFNDTKEEAQFREEVSTWLGKNAEKKEHARDVYKYSGVQAMGQLLKMRRTGWQKNMTLAGLVFIGQKIMVEEMLPQWKE